ncbi:MAG: hypothetical protein A2051_13565 [Desulfovibrionales bacterium GWA2_65_9]|nr:MAG: hypothetical protein A2051_13565 [Desulfovibrionales bacterium GWA2_65_9]
MGRPRVRIFCDYEAEGIWDYPCGCDWPKDCSPEIWHENTTHAPDLLILRDLALWNRRYSTWFADWERSIRGEGEPPTAWFDPDAFTAEGLRLASLLKINHPDWKIIFIDEVAYLKNYYADLPEDRSFNYEIELGPEGKFLARELPG